METAAAAPTRAPATAFGLETVRRAAWARAWETICFHLDGIGLAPTMAALNEAGVLERLLGEPASSLDDLAAQSGARDGYLGVALRALELQGWLEPVAAAAGAPPRYRPTAAGRAALSLGSFYARAASRLRRLAVYRQGLFEGGGEGALGELFDELLASRGEAPPSDDPSLARRAALHRDGVVLCPLVFALYRRGLFAGLTPEANAIDLAAVAGDRHVLAAACDVLAALGWASRDGSRVRFTEDGVCHVLTGMQYWYAAYYIDLLLATRDLLFGEEIAIRKGTSAELEPLLDRGLSIEFSGRVFRGAVRKPFLSLFLPIFDREPVEEQPRWVVDMGSGDGTMLRDLYECIRRGTLRGRHLDRVPLTMIGAEYHEIARRTTEQTLAQAGIPHLAVRGDVDDPEALRAELAGAGVAIEDALHVSKSVVHNRRYRPPRDAAAAARRVPRSRWIPVAEDGSRIPLGDYEQNLVEHFERWRPCTSRFGMVIADAHTVPPEQVAAHLGRTVMTILEITHGYSNQYLVEAEVFRAAAEEAGFAVPFQRTVGAATLGHDYMSVSRLVPVPQG